MSTREQILDEMIKNSTPMQVVNPEAREDGSSIWRYLGQLTRNVRPMVVVAGPVEKMRNGVPVAVTPEDEELLKATRTVRKKNETLMEFYSRTGIGAHQCRTLPRRELERLVSVVEQNEGMKDTPDIFTKPAPRRGPIFVDTWS